MLPLVTGSLLDVGCGVAKSPVVDAAVQVIIADLATVRRTRDDRVGIPACVPQTDGPAGRPQIKSEVVDKKVCLEWR